MAMTGFRDNDTSDMASGRLDGTGEIPMTRITKLGLIYARSIRGTWSNVILNTSTEERKNYSNQ